MEATWGNVFFVFLLRMAGFRDRGGLRIVGDPSPGKRRGWLAAAAELLQAPLIP